MKTSIRDISCLSVKDGPLSESALFLALTIANEMIEKNEHRLRRSFMNGEIESETSFMYHAIGGFCGVKFSGRIDTDNKTLQIEYLVNPRNLGPGVYVYSTMNVKDFYSLN